MILRLVKMHFNVDDTEQFLAYFKTIKHKIESMPGNLSLKLYQDSSNRNVLFTHSIWLNAQSLEDYRHSEEFREIWPKTKAMFATKAEAWSLNLK